MYNKFKFKFFKLNFENEKICERWKVGEKYMQNLNKNVKSFEAVIHTYTQVLLPNILNSNSNLQNVFVSFINNAKIKLRTSKLFM